MLFSLLSHSLLPHRRHCSRVFVFNVTMDSDTLTGLLENVAKKFPDRRALSVSGKFDLTHARLHDLIERAASRLVSAAGIKPGYVVALTFPNTVEVVF